MTEVTRVLKPGGIIYISDYFIRQDKTDLLRYQAFARKYQCYGVFELEEGAILRHHTKAYMAQLFKPFHTIWCKDIEVITMNGHRSKAFQYLGRIP